MLFAGFLSCLVYKFIVHSTIFYCLESVCPCVCPCVNAFNLVDFPPDIRNCVVGARSSASYIIWERELKYWVYSGVPGSLKRNSARRELYRRASIDPTSPQPKRSLPGQSNRWKLTPNHKIPNISKSTQFWIAISVSTSFYDQMLSIGI